MLWKSIKNKESDRTLEIKGFMVYASQNLQGELTEEEQEFIQHLTDKLHKASRGFKHRGVRLKSLNILTS